MWTLRADEWWMPVEEIRAENFQRKSMPTSILSMHCCPIMSSKKTGKIKPSSLWVVICITLRKIIGVYFLEMKRLSELFCKHDFRCKDVLRTRRSWSLPMKEHTTTRFQFRPQPWLLPPRQLLPCYYPALQPLSKVSFPIWMQPLLVLNSMD